MLWKRTPVLLVIDLQVTFKRKSLAVITWERQDMVCPFVKVCQHIFDVSLGEHWRRLRRCAREILTPQACRNHLTIQQAEATQLMYDLVVKPEVAQPCQSIYTVADEIPGFL